MNIGAFYNRITVQNSVYGANSYGERELTWSDYATLWADIKYTNSATENVNGEQYISEQKIIFIIRYSFAANQIDNKYRIQFDGKTYEITGVHHIGRQDRIKLITNLLE